MIENDERIHSDVLQAAMLDVDSEEKLIKNRAIEEKNAQKASAKKAVQEEEKANDEAAIHFRADDMSDEYVGYWSSSKLLNNFI